MKGSFCVYIYLLVSAADTKMSPTEKMSPTWVPHESHKKQSYILKQKGLRSTEYNKTHQITKKNYIITLYVSINRSFSETRPAGKNDNSGCTSGFIVESLFIYLFIYLFTHALICLTFRSFIMMYYIDYFLIYFIN